MAKNDNPEAEVAEAGDAPLIDLNDASIKKLIARAKKRGFVTYDELNEALPQDQMSSEQIEDIMSAINELGINVVENEEASDDEEEKEDEPEPAIDDEVDPLDDGGPRPAAATKKEPTDRTDDPVRMYLREMGAVELLSREGEIAIAKRIEAGRDTMIWGLCESPITFNAIIGWSNALNEGRMQLREILDLEAMLSKGPTAEQLNETEEGGENAEGEISEKVAGPSIKEEEEVADEPEAGANEDDEDMVERRTQPQGEEDDEDNTLSLAQMEETLKPAALEKFAEITSIFKKFSKVQAHRMEAFAAGQEFPASDEKKYHKLREQLTAEVESVQFHGSKIETLVEAL
jgi:RNA polymerase primary sigma factor